MVMGHEAVRHAIPELEDLLWAKVRHQDIIPSQNRLRRQRTISFSFSIDPGALACRSPLFSHTTTPLRSTLFSIYLQSTGSRRSRSSSPLHHERRRYFLLGMSLGRSYLGSVLVYGVTAPMFGVRWIGWLAEKRFWKWSSTETVRRSAPARNLYEDIVNNPEWLELMERVEYAWYGGGT